MNIENSLLYVFFNLQKNISLPKNDDWDHVLPKHSIKFRRFAKDQKFLQNHIVLKNWKKQVPLESIRVQFVTVFTKPEIDKTIMLSGSQDYLYVNHVYTLNPLINSLRHLGKKNENYKLFAANVYTRSDLDFLMPCIRELDIETDWKLKRKFYFNHFAYLVNDSFLIFLEDVYFCSFVERRNPDKIESELQRLFLIEIGNDDVREISSAAKLFLSDLIKCDSFWQYFAYPKHKPTPTLMPPFKAIDTRGWFTTYTSTTSVIENTLGYSEKLKRIENFVFRTLFSLSDYTSKCTPYILIVQCPFADIHLSEVEHSLMTRGYIPDTFPLRACFVNVKQRDEAPEKGVPVMFVTPTHISLCFGHPPSKPNLEDLFMPSFLIRANVATGGDNQNSFRILRVNDKTLLDPRAGFVFANIKLWFYHTDDVENDVENALEHIIISPVKLLKNQCDAKNYLQNVLGIEVVRITVLFQTNLHNLIVASTRAQFPVKIGMLIGENLRSEDKHELLLELYDNYQSWFNPLISALVHL